MRKQIVIDFDSGLAGICFADGTIVEPAVFVANELNRSWVAAKSASSAPSRLTPGL